MNFFKKRGQEKPKPTDMSAGLPRQGDTIAESLKAHSRFIKRVNCSQCGAPKSLPSPTAYIYCDYCGSLMDYDFRMANADTNAGLTNTVFHRIIATVQAPLMQAKTGGDRDAYRQIYRQVFSQWLQECPTAASPRARNDAVFREQLIAYFAECAVIKDLDPQQAVLDVRMNALTAALQRIPMPGNAWRVAGPFWEYAAWIEQFAREGITAGCGGGNYCPESFVTRAQMAVFLLKSKHGAGYVPPPASGTMFTDVPQSYWAAAWIEQLVREGISSGCSASQFCPETPVTRAQMAVFVVKTFNLP